MYIIKSAVNVVFRVHISEFAHRRPRIKHSCETRINAAREQALSLRYCYSRDINRDAICSARLQWDSAKCSFPRIMLSATAREMRQKLAGGDCFPCFPIESSRNYFRCPFHSSVRLVNRSIGERSIDRESRHAICPLATEYEDIEDDLWYRFSRLPPLFYGTCAPR